MRYFYHQIKYEPIKSILILALSLSSLLLSPVSEAKQLRIATFDQESVQIDVTFKVLRKVYQRLGHDIELVRFPGRRSLVETNNGETHGELIRIKSLENKFTNLLRIPTSVASMKLMAFSLKENAPVVGIAGLIGKRVGIVRGVEITDRLTKNQDRQMVNSIESLFQILLNGQVDLVIFPKLDSQFYLNAHNLNDKVVMSKHPLMEIKLFHYLHKSQAEMAKQLTELLKQMDSHGELDALNYSIEQTYQ